MNGEGSKCLGGALREANIRQALLLGCFEDVADTVGNIVEGELVDGKVPELGRRGRAMDRLFRILVSPVVAQLILSVLITRIEPFEPTQTSNPLSTNSNGRHRSASVRATQTSEFIRRPW